MLCCLVPRNANCTTTSIDRTAVFKISCAPAKTISRNVLYWARQPGIRHIAARHSYDTYGHYQSYLLNSRWVLPSVIEHMSEYDDEYDRSPLMLLLRCSNIICSSVQPSGPVYLIADETMKRKALNRSFYVLICKGRSCNTACSSSISATAPSFCVPACCRSLRGGCNIGCKADAAARDCSTFLKIEDSVLREKICTNHDAFECFGG